MRIAHNKMNFCCKLKRIKCPYNAAKYGKITMGTKYCAIVASCERKLFEANNLKVSVSVHFPMCCSCYYCCCLSPFFSRLCRLVWFSVDAVVVLHQRQIKKDTTVVQ